MSNYESDSELIRRIEHTSKAGGETEKSKIRLPWKTGGAIAVLVVIGGTGSFAYGAATGNMPKVVTEVEAQEVKADVKSVEVGIEPITVSSALSNTETTIENTDSIEIFGAKVPVQHTELRRTGMVEGNFTFDPQNVEASYDADTEQVTITVPSTALSTEVSVVTGTGRTEHVSELGVKWALDSMGQFIKYADGILGTDSSKDPLLSKVIDGTLGVQETLENIADLKAAEGVDQECTEKIRGIDGFDTALTDAVRTLSTKEVIASAFLEDLDVKSSERRKLIESAKLVFDDGDTFTIGHDEAIAKRVDLYNKIFNTTTTVSPVTCSVDDTTKFTVNNQEKRND